MTPTRLLSLFALAAAATPAFAADAPAPTLDLGLPADPVFLAQDEEDEDPADGESVREERESVKKTSGASDASAAEAEERGKKRIIKTIQKKNFMKIGRYEVGPSIGFLANDPFLNRYIVGGVFDYHLTEVFAAEIQVGYSPILGDGGESDPDWKPLTKQLLLQNNVSPDISKLTAHGSVGLAFAPIYGKAAIGRKIIAFDIYGHFGLGATQTTDDLVALQACDNSGCREEAVATESQVHPTTVIGGGARVAFSEGLAARIEGKSMSYVEVVNSQTLEMKNNFILQANVSFFFPGME